ncbi:MAG TPA: GNAT family N-acetyltransferase, partial [Actinomycetota bacterium]|nr:GNAT family N-acetyltransferase [Actinomycetota bacterium]
RGEPVALAALLIRQGVAYLDHVVTWPDARRRGHAAALTARLTAEAAAAGAERAVLLAEPGGPAAAMYGRRGFRPVTQLASWISPLSR